MIFKLCKRCTGFGICSKEDMEGIKACDYYELDILSEDYVNEFIEMNRKEYQKEYISYTNDSDYAGYAD